MGNKVLILVEDGFRDEELIYPYYRFIEAGYEVKIVGPKAGREYKGNSMKKNFFLPPRLRQLELGLL